MQQYTIYFKDKRELNNFINVLEEIPYDIYLKREDGFTANAKSYIAVLMAFNWKEILCLCKEDISKEIKEFIKEN